MVSTIELGKASLIRLMIRIALFEKLVFKHLIRALTRGYDSVIRRMQSWVCLLYNLYNTNKFILHVTPGHKKNELIGVV